MSPPTGLPSCASATPDTSPCTASVREIPFVGYSWHVTKDKPDTAETQSGPQGADEDVVSDPAKDAGEGGDWSDEGGATPSGPADTGDHTQ